MTDKPEVTPLTDAMCDQEFSSAAETVQSWTTLARQLEREVTELRRKLETLGKTAADNFAAAVEAQERAGKAEAALAEKRANREAERQERLAKCARIIELEQDRDAIASLIHAWMHSCPTDSEVVARLCELNAALATEKKEG